MNKIALLLLIFTCGCTGIDNVLPEDDLSNLPKDFGGSQKAFLLGATESPFGFYIYTPSNYDENNSNYPLLIFLHGIGERGNSELNPPDLDKVLTNGPPNLIKKEKWTPPSPMIVASPQLVSGFWKPNEVHSFIEFIIQTYRINQKRIYLTGLSLGAIGCFDYIGNKGTESFVAAIIPIAGGASNLNYAEKFINTPVWAFHGDADNVINVNQSIKIINAINRVNADPRAKLTIYPNVGHNSWSRTYDCSGMGQERDDCDPFEITIYDWMLKYQNK